MNKYYKIEEKRRKFAKIEDNYYLTFVLGYDLLQADLNGLPCDTCFKICKNIIFDFLASEELKNYSLSTYDCLQNYINNNYNTIKEYIIYNKE